MIYRILTAMIAAALVPALGNAQQIELRCIPDNSWYEENDEEIGTAHVDYSIDLDRQLILRRSTGTSGQTYDQNVRIDRFDAKEIVATLDRSLDLTFRIDRYESSVQFLQDGGPLSGPETCSVREAAF